MKSIMNWLIIVLVAACSFGLGLLYADDVWQAESREHRWYFDQGSRAAEAGLGHDWSPYPRWTNGETQFRRQRAWIDGWTTIKAQQNTRR